MKPLIIFALVFVLPIACAAQSPTLRSVLGVVGRTDSTFGFSLERLRTTEAAVLRGAFVDEISVEGARYTSRGLADGFLLCVNNNLRRQWLQIFGGPGYDAITCMKPLPDGGLAVGMICGAGADGITTYRIGDVTFTGRGGADAVVFVLNTDGTVRWVRNDGAINAEYPTSIAIVDDSLIVVAGIFIQKSRFGSENIADSAEISGYVQAISLAGIHRWVRVVHGRGVNGSSAAVQVDVRHVHATSGRIGVVVQSTESIRWGDSTLVVSTEPQKRTTAVVYVGAMGNILGIEGVETCVAERTSFGSFLNNICAAAAEFATDACIAFPVDAITWRADARSPEARRSFVPAPQVIRTHDVVAGPLISGATETQPLVLALDNQGNERWRYVYPTPEGGLMYDAMQSEALIIAVARSTNVELLSLDLPSAVDGNKNTRMERDANIVYNSNIRELLADGYTLMTLTGARVTESAASSPYSQTLAPQVCILMHTTKPSRVVLYFCK